MAAYTIYSRYEQYRVQYNRVSLTDWQRQLHKLEPVFSDAVWISVTARLGVSVALFDSWLDLKKFDFYSERYVMNICIWMY